MSCPVISLVGVRTASSSLGQVVSLEQNTRGFSNIFRKNWEEQKIPNPASKYLKL